jgi:hypothetical protein
MLDRRRFVALVAPALLAACGPLRRSGPSADSAEIIFRNESLDQAGVYVIAQSGLRTRIGTVSAGRTETLRVPPTAIGGSGTVTVVADILARSRTPTSGSIPLGRGQRILVTLRSDQRMLTVLPARDP